MARARNLKPSFFQNEDLAACGPLGMLLFEGLWCHADREGRLEDRPVRIKVQILPYFEADCDALLNCLAKYGFILRYEVEGIKYIQVLNFAKHQNPHVKEANSTIPAPDKYSARPGIAGTSRADSLNPLTDSLNPLPEKQTRASADALSVRFAAFWLAYPKKKSKGHAEKAWKRINPNEQLHDRIMNALERAKTSDDWRKNNGQFIPHPSTWLNAKGWEDEVSTRQKPRSEFEGAL